MKALIQRVSRAAVEVNGECVGRIESGLLALIGIAPLDGSEQVRRLLDKLLGCRIFEDAQGRMNLNVRDAGGGLLLVPNFTLMADTRKGQRPSFAKAASPAQARALFDELCALAATQGLPLGCGIFGADMQVSLVNDGPVTLMLEVEAN